MAENGLLVFGGLYRQQFSFFDAAKINESVRFVNLSEVVSTGNFDEILVRMTQEIEAFSPAMVFVDSVRSVWLEGRHPQGTTGIQQIIQRTSRCTTPKEADETIINDLPRA